MIHHNIFKLFLNVVTSFEHIILNLYLNDDIFKAANVKHFMMMLLLIMCI